MVPAAQDWSLDLATYPMSIMLAAGGISAALVGKWTLRVRTRCKGGLEVHLSDAVQMLRT